HLAQLMKRVQAHKALLLERRRAIFVDEGSLGVEDAGVVIELGFFQEYAAAAFPPCARGHLSQDVVTVDDIEQKPPTGLQRAVDTLQHFEVRAIVKIPE